jgi:hypothetical protein
MAKTIGANTTADQLLAFGALLGRSGKTIESEISGNSMGDTLPSGCRIRICALRGEEYRPGQVVAFVSGGTICAHRIVHRSRQGVLTRGDSQSWCDLPVPTSAIIGVVSGHTVNGKWFPFDDHTGFQYERNTCRQLIDTLLGVCLQLDIRIALHVSKGLMRLARRRRKLLADFLRIGDLTK